MVSLRPRRAPAVLGLIVAWMLTLLFAQTALALFTKAVTGGPLTVASATLVAPSKTAALQSGCRNGKTPEVEVSWAATTSAFATSYSLERATKSSGPYSLVASVLIGTLAHVDTSSLSASTTYYYRVSSIFKSWSATSLSASVKTESCSN
jgi:hypothetical protein